MKKILILSPYPAYIEKVIRESGDLVVIRNDKICASEILNQNIKSIVSFGYRHILCSEEIQAVNGLAVNLLFNYLPFNKVAHPNLWSITEGTTSGVKIHLMDQGLYTGNMLYQKEIAINEDFHTFSTSYTVLTQEILRLFELN